MNSKKVILLGKYGVGKTSLIRQFMHKEFSDAYLTTIGVKIEKKIVTTNEGPLAMIIWDIAGESSHRKIPPSYKLGSQGIIYVFDLSRLSTYEALDRELSDLKTLLPNVPISLVGNKKDLLNEKDLDTIAAKLPLVDVTFTSARTGENVEKLFHDLALAMVR